jgi:hypothetical protein
MAATIEEFQLGDEIAICHKPSWSPNVCVDIMLIETLDPDNPQKIVTITRKQYHREIVGRMESVFPASKRACDYTNEFSIHFGKLDGVTSKLFLAKRQGELYRPVRPKDLDVTGFPIIPRPDDFGFPTERLVDDIVDRPMAALNVPTTRKNGIFADDNPTDYRSLEPKMKEFITLGRYKAKPKYLEDWEASEDDDD